jgi:WD40 repeat protein
MGELKAENISNSNSGGLVFSSDGSILASANSDNSISLWSVADQKLLGQPLKSQSLGITSLEFHPNGKFLFSGNGNGSLIIWDVIARRTVGSPLNLHIFPINNLRYKVDMDTLVSGDSEGNVVIWDMSPDTWITKACIRAGRNFTQAEWLQYFTNEKYRITCSQWVAGE